MSDSSSTVKPSRNLTFVVADTRCRPGAGRRTRRPWAGGSGVRITEFVKTGKPVLVTYRETNGRNQAVSVRPISTAGSGDGPKSESAKIASGKVTSITASALTVNHDGQDLTFAVDAATTVSAPGAGRRQRRRAAGFRSRTSWAGRHRQRHLSERGQRHECLAGSHHHQGTLEPVGELVTWVAEIKSPSRSKPPIH